MLFSKKKERVPTSKSHVEDKIQAFFKSEYLKNISISRIGLYVSQILRRAFYSAKMLEC